MSETKPGSGRGVARWRRHLAAGVMIGSLVGTAILLGALRMPRVYQATVVLDRHVDLASPPVPVTPVVDATRSDLQKIIAATPLGARAGDTVGITITPGESGRDRIALSLRASNPDDAAAMLSTILATYAVQVEHAIGEQLRQQGQTIDTRVVAAAAAVKQAQDQVQRFESDHPGFSAEEQANRAAALDRLNARIDDRTQQAALLDQQIAQLNGTPAATEQPTATAPNTPVVNVDADPEVLALRAQAALLAEQLTEQTETLHRTEQHPYVIELRGRQADLQKRLDAAIARAQAGKPAPEGIKAPVEGDANAAQLQQAQLKGLQAQRAALTAQIADLEKQRDAMQKGGDDFAALRRADAQLQAQATAAEKDLADAREQQRVFVNQYSVNDDAGLATAAASIIDFGHPFPDGNLYDPVSPQFWMVALAGLGAAVVSGIASAALALLLDRKLHGVADVQSVVGAPVLGAIIRYNRQGDPRRQFTFLGPILAMASAAALIAAEVVAYNGLAGRRTGDTNSANENPAASVMGMSLTQEERR